MNMALKTGFPLPSIEALNLPSHLPPPHPSLIHPLPSHPPFPMSPPEQLRSDIPSGAIIRTPPSSGPSTTRYYQPYQDPALPMSPTASPLFTNSGSPSPKQAYEQQHQEHQLGHRSSFFDNRIIPSNESGPGYFPKLPLVDTPVRSPNKMSIDRIVNQESNMFQFVEQDNSHSQYGDYRGPTIPMTANIMQHFQENPHILLDRNKREMKRDRIARQTQQGNLQTLLPAVQVHRSSQPSIPRWTPTDCRRGSATSPQQSPIPQALRPVESQPNSKGQNRVKKPRARPQACEGSPTENKGKKVGRVDKDFQSIPDFSPPLNTIPQGLLAHKIEWQSEELDMTNQPYRHLLHPDELKLASILRLPCDTYIASKRRIFQGRVECAARGRPFRRTNAQQACRIDVNKASKLHQAFDNIGWFHEELVRDHVERRKKEIEEEERIKKENEAEEKAAEEAKLLQEARDREFAASRACTHYPATLPPPG